MQIKEIKIHNFRSIIDEKFYMNDFSVLVGENNSGKTNIINGIRYFYGNMKFEKEKDFPKTEVKDNEVYIDVCFQLNNEEYSDIKDEYKTADKKINVRKYLDTGKYHIIKEDGEMSQDQFYGAKGVAEGKLGRVVYIPSVSKTDDILKTSGTSPFRDIINYITSDILEKSEAFDGLRKSFEIFDKKISGEENHKGESISSLSKKINTEISSWKEVKFDIKINAITTDLILKNLISPSLFDNNFKKDISIDNLGQGFQRSLISSLIKIDAELKNSEKRQKKDSSEKKVFSPDFTLILFEEPEAFLHFTQEEKLNNNLNELSKDNNKQVLISTHSTYFTSKNIENITNIIKLQKKQTTKVGQLSQADIEEILSYNAKIVELLGTQQSFLDSSEMMRYFLWLNQDRSSLFFAQKVLLVEGQSDKLFLDYMFASDFDDIRLDGVYLIDCMGKFNIVRFMNLLKHFQIEHYVLFDKDDDKNSKGIDHGVLNQHIIDSKNIHTLDIDYYKVDLEDFIGIEVAGRDKPLNLLYKFKSGEISDEKLFQLKIKIKKLLFSDEDFEKSEDSINTLISLYDYVLKFESVSVGDKGEFEYKYNEAKDFFDELNFNKSYHINKDNKITRQEKDTYFLNIIRNISLNSEGLDMFIEYHKETIEKEEGSDECVIVELYDKIIDLR